MRPRDWPVWSESSSEQISLSGPHSAHCPASPAGFQSRKPQTRKTSQYPLSANQGSIISPLVFTVDISKYQPVETKNNKLWNILSTNVNSWQSPPPHAFTTSLLPDNSGIILRYHYCLLDSKHSNFLPEHEAETLVTRDPGFPCCTHLWVSTIFHSVSQLKDTKVVLHRQIGSALWFCTRREFKGIVLDS